MCRYGPAGWDEMNVRLVRKKPNISGWLSDISAGFAACY
jgi:hypothetical protein